MELIQALEYLNKDKKYLLAVSGGVDSMVLLYLFLNSELAFSVVHCNFQLRNEESDLDEQLVTDYCSTHHIELFVKKFDTLQLKKSRESVEMIARELRYNYFQELLSTYSFDFLVTAHHLNDNVETFFINLLRGSGLKGLSGMQFQNGKILRPLLSFTRKEILNFALAHNIKWREDKSNQTLDYLRNKIRHKIIPELEHITPSFLHQAEKSMKIIAKSQQFIEKETKKLETEILISSKNDNIIFSLKKLKESDPILIYHFLSRFGFTNEQDCKNILSAKTGSTFDSQTHKIWIDREELIVENNTGLQKQNISFLIDRTPYETEKPFYLKIETLNHRPEKGTYTELVDFEKISFPLVVRTWKEGDYFYPINGKGKKKISKYLKDEKISNFDKGKVFVLCDNSNSIIWLIGFRLDDRFKISEKSKKYLILT